MKMMFGLWFALGRSKNYASGLLGKVLPINIKKLVRKNPIHTHVITGIF